MTATISQYGITWTFDREYPYGTFANGDFWVVGPVTIVGMSPAAAGGMNGWDVNPLPQNPQGYDNRCDDYDAADMPALAYLAAPGSSIVKTVSLADTNQGGAYPNCLRTAAVLTVLAAPPPGNGASVFRPPYVGSEKPYYATASLQTALLPQLAPVAGAPALADIVARLGRVQLDHLNGRWLNETVYEYGGVPNAELNPIDNMANYGPNIANENGDAILRVMLDDPLPAKMAALVAVVQGGIDRYHALKNGQMWPPGSGWQQGRKISIAFAAVMLGDDAMKQAVTAPNVFPIFFFEDTAVQSGSGGRALFDNIHATAGWYQESPGDPPGYDYYWSWTRQTIGVNDGPGDPYGFIDGSMNAMQSNDAYQLCCTSMSFKGEALVGHLMPEVRAVWGHPEFFDYVDRWVTHGVLSQPDPCAPLSQGGGPDPSHPGSCVLDPDLTPGSTMQQFSCQPGKQCGRFPEYDGLYADQGYYQSDFANAMWSAYRNR
jgi:hypothetical protein